MNTNGKTWKILVAVILAAFGAVYGYGKHVERVETLKKTETKADNNENAIIGLQKDIEYIKKGVDDIKGELKDARRGKRTTE